MPNAASHTEFQRSQLSFTQYVLNEAGAYYGDNVVLPDGVSAEALTYRELAIDAIPKTPAGRILRRVACLGGRAAHRCEFSVAREGDIGLRARDERAVPSRGIGGASAGSDTTDIVGGF